MDEDRRLSARARDAIDSAAEPLISAATLFEMAIKESIGKLELFDGWTDLLIEQQHFGFLPILPAHTSALGGMPFVSVNGTEIRDPFDRLLIAQAEVEGVPVITRDPAIAAHGVPTIW